MTYENDSKWEIREVIDRAEIEKYGDIDENISKLLILRGIEPEGVEEFYDPDIITIPDFKKLHGAKTAAKEIVEAVKGFKRIFIHGDFDADGICATSLLWDFIYRELADFLDVSVNILPYIPSRGDEGYGLSEASVDAILEKGADLIITVDCGVRDGELINKYSKDTDTKFLITDHHQPPDGIEKESYTIVHPMFPGKEYPQQEISGTYVALLLVQAIKEHVGLPWKFEPKFNGLDLVAISTVSDMMPLIDHNRNILKHGLRQINDSKRIGLAKLIELAGLNENEIDAYHLGFVLGPRINAAGRIGNAIDAVRLLSTHQSSIATNEAAKLDQLNKDRQQLTEKALEEAESQIDDSSKIIVIRSDEWQEGLIGLIAGKLMEKYMKPVIAITTIDQTKGSARSLDGYNITDALGRNSKYLLKYGGHAEAAGFSIVEGEIDSFTKAIIKDAEKEIPDKGLEKVLKYDLDVNSDDLTIQFIEELNRFRPFGMSNSKPLFRLEKAVVTDKFVMGSGKNHLKLSIKSGLETLPALMFNTIEDIDSLEIDDVIDVVGYPDINHWNGRTTVQFMVKAWKKTEL